jgi:hypothetical protein
MSAPDLESPAKRLERAAMSKRGSVSNFTIQPLDGEGVDTTPEVAKEKRRWRRREKQQLWKDAAASVGLPPIARRRDHHRDARRKRQGEVRAGSDGRHRSRKSSTT